MGGKWKNYSNMTIDRYTALKKFVDTNKLRIDVSYSVNGKPINDNTPQQSNAVSKEYADLL